MKLLTYTSRIQLLFFLILFGIFSILFYLVLNWNVLQNVDEVLYNRKDNLLAYLKENQHMQAQQLLILISKNSQHEFFEKAIELLDKMEY